MEPTPITPARIMFPIPSDVMRIFEARDWRLEVGEGRGICPISNL
jgi:hypothetical protein